MIKKYEGFRADPYLCPAGIPTIGYGTTGKDITLAHPPVTEAWAAERMQHDLEYFINEVKKASPVLALPWHELRLCAITSFCYNLGMTRYRASTLRRKVNAGDWDEARTELMKWIWAGGRKLPGLVARRSEEAALL